MSNTALKIDFQALESQKEFPVYSLLTKVLIQSLCPILKSEIVFGNVETTDPGEKFGYWIDAKITGDLEGTLGVGADSSTLKALALTQKIKKANGQPDIEQALVTIHEALAVAMETQFAEEDFKCDLRKGTGLVSDYIFNPPNDPFFMCPVETKFGVFRVYFSFKASSHELIDELSSHGKIVEPRKIRVYASQLESLFSNIKGLEKLETRLLTGPQVRSQMRSQIKKLKRMLTQLKSESLETLFSPAKKLTTEIAKSQGKQVKFITCGTWLFMDKSLLNYLYEPVLHLIRNAVDHGIEDSSERERNGKNPVGTVKCLAAFNNQGLRLIVSDDGRGLDFNRIRQQAVAKGFYTQDEAIGKLSDDLSELVFKSGFSTREKSDAVSGRGLGLDVCRRNITAIDGTIKILSTSAKGTSFEILIPLNEDFSLQKMQSIEEEENTEDEKNRLMDDLSGYIEQLVRVLMQFKSENTVETAYEGYRLAHSIKGVTGFIGWNRVAAFCHHLEDVLKLVSEKKIPFGETLSDLLLESGKNLSDFCESSRTSASFSLYKIRSLEARLLQLVWGATQSEERTHLFFGKYHLEAVEKFLTPLSGGAGFKISAETDFAKVMAQPCGSLVQFNGDRRGYAAVLMGEDAFSDLLYPYISGATSKRSAKQEAQALSEFARVMGNEITDTTSKRGINLSCSTPLTYYGVGEPLKILGTPTYCYRAEIGNHVFYFAGDFRLPSEVPQHTPQIFSGFNPKQLIRDAKELTEKQLLKWGMPIVFNEQSSQSDLIGFDTGMTNLIKCVSPGKSTPDFVLFASYEKAVAQNLRKAICKDSEGAGFEILECINEAGKAIGNGMIMELEKRKFLLQLAEPTVLLGKAYTANFNQLYVTSKFVGVTAFGKVELQLLITV